MRRSVPEPVLRRVLGAGALLAAIAGAVALLRDTAYQGQDFEVFWKTAHATLHGAPAYDAARDGAMAFKYPPWILPAFFPFALVPLFAAKWAWGAVELASLAAVFHWCWKKARVEPVRLSILAFAFWGIWAVHCMDGQITLPLLALLLHARSWGAHFYGLSAKVFTLVSLPSSPARPRSRQMLVMLASCAVLTLPALWVAPGRSPRALVSSWAEAAESGGTAFEKGKIRGRDNQGFPALILRAARVPASRTDADFAAFVAAALILGMWWLRASRKLSAEARWAGSLGLGAAVHPLAWFHLYVFAFPLAAMSLQTSSRKRSRLTRGLAISGAICLCLITRKTLGPLGEALELASIKAWGAAMCAWALLRASSRA